MLLIYLIKVSNVYYPLLSILLLLKSMTLSESYSANPKPS